MKEKKLGNETYKMQLGDDAYKGKGLVKLVGWVRTSIKRRYAKAAKKRGWSKIQFNSYWFTKNAPK